MCRLESSHGQDAGCSFVTVEFLALFSPGDANVKWLEDDAAVIPVLSATREADGSAEEQSESTKSAIAFDIALNWWNVGVLL